MKGMKKNFIISAKTVARLVKIKEYKAKLSKLGLRGTEKSVIKKINFCNRCQWDSMHVCSRLPWLDALGKLECAFFHKKEKKP